MFLFITKLKGFTMNEISSALNNSNRVLIQYFLKVCWFTCNISWKRHFFEQFYKYLYVIDIIFKKKSSDLQCFLIQNDCGTIS